MNRTHLPQFPGNRQRFDLDVAPPRFFVAVPMQFLVMDAAEGDGELIADLATERPLLGKPDVMGISGRLLTNQTWLPSHELKMDFAALAGGFLW